MPRPHGDRLAMEAALTASELQVLDEACRRLGIPRDRWHLAPAVAGFFELFVFAQAVERIQETEGAALESAQWTAGIRLDLNDEAVVRRMRRQRKRSERPDKTSGVKAAS